MILVLTPLSLEYEELKAALEETGWRPQIEKNGHLTGTVYRDQAVALYIGGHGKTQFALHTQHLLHHIKDVQGVLCIGASGSLTKSVKPGDLVIAEKTIEHDFNLKFVKKGLPEFPADEKFLEIARRLKNPGRHLGTVASGDEDVLDSGRAFEIFQKTEALAVAWEGAGGARACQFHRVPYLEIRAITDFADTAAPKDFRRHLQTGMKAAAVFLQEFVRALV